VGPTVHRLAAVGSTQDEARRLVGEGTAEPGHVVVADTQRAGRGRFGREWISPRGNLYATFVLARDPLHAIRAGIAVARTLETFGIQARLKWPNDVTVGGKKIAGVLIEDAGAAALVGIGVNVAQAPLGSATCVRSLGCSIDRNNLLGELWEVLSEDVGPAEVLAAYRSLSDTIGRRVRVSIGNERRAIDGIAKDVDERGRLLVEVADETHTISCGDCLHLDEVRLDWSEEAKR
jgi:BirA family biotin operon repressor/biotin-[acetyl-CoA-carboxylase] ligase